MIGTRIFRTPSGCPYGGNSSARAFTRDDVAAVGRIRLYNDNRRHYAVRLRDGVELFVSIAGQGSKADADWLRGLAGGVLLPADVRGRGFAESWVML